MTADTISKAMQRVRTVLTFRPQAGVHADEPAIARWSQGVRLVCYHANGTQIATDLPTELGGSGDQITPAWLLRAGLASCVATRIAMQAAVDGIGLTRLEVAATSTSDARGILGMVTSLGERITAGPREVRLQVRIGAPGVTPERLRTMIDDSYHCSPVAAALEGAVPVALHIEIDPG